MMEEALLYLRAVPRVPLVWFIGHPCRTWFVDQADVADMLEILRQVRMFHPVYTSGWGFDVNVAEMSAVLGLVTYEVAPLSMTEDKRIGRDPEVVASVDMIVAFPQEEVYEPNRSGRPSESVGQLGWETADPDLSHAIRESGVPVLVVYRTGETKWICSPQMRSPSSPP